MHRNLIFKGFLIGALIFLGAVYIYVKNNITEEPVGTIQPPEISREKIYSNSRFGFEFRYPRDYFLEEREMGDAHREQYTIILTEDTEENRRVREGKEPGREGPRAITLDIYQNNLDRQSLESWVKGTNDSNFKLSNGTYRESTIAGKRAFAYEWDGLYRGETTAFLHGDEIYALSVTFLTFEDETRNVFKGIQNSLKFE